MHLLALIVFAAAIQGLLLGYFLLRLYGRSLQHRLLALLSIVMSIVMLAAVLGLSGYYLKWPHLLRIADPFVLLFGPLLYFHVHAATRGSLPSRVFAHFIPFVAYVLFIIPFYALPGAGKIAILEQALAPPLHPMVATILVVRITHMLLYSVLSLGLVRRFQHGLRDRFSNVDERDLHRSVWFLLGYISVTIGMMAIIVAGMFMRIHVIPANGIFALLLGACIYAMAYVSWPHPSAGGPAGAMRTVASPPRTDAVEVEAGTIGRPERTVHHLSDDQLKMLAGRMIGALEQERAYLDGDLTLAQLSERMNAPAYQVSEVINRHYRSNFFDAVNRLRVEEVKRRLTDPAHSAYSILGIAMDSGFNSKSSFNSAFRKHTGTTPSRFRMN